MAGRNSVDIHTNLEYQAAQKNLRRFEAEVKRVTGNEYVFKLSIRKDGLNNAKAGIKAVQQGITGINTGLANLYKASGYTSQALGKAKAGAKQFAQEVRTLKNDTGVLGKEARTTSKAVGELNKSMGGASRAKTTATRQTKRLTEAEKEHNQAVANGNRILSRAQSIITGFAVGAYVAGIRSALVELRNVDTELVTIQKVTGQTRQEVQALADESYTTAAKYGAIASDYLSSVASFARAGYQENAKALGELSLMTQKVGDVDAKTADQFLLSVDAAYQYKGSIQELTKVLDGANEIGNKFATDVNKITAGLGIVSNVAKQANVDIDEVTAALGTITATTQRSGSEAARALRAIYLNIAADISTELDEDTGDHWTAEEVEAMASSLQKFGIYTRYVKDGMEQLRNPMEVIGEIAEKVKSGMISEVELNDLFQGLGGKLRSNQLLAMINNWDMYISMLDTYRTAEGSAEEELGIYLDSWEAKAAKLQATWTELVNKTLDSEGIKDFLDFGTTILEAADNLELLTANLAGFLTLINANKIGSSVTGFADMIKGIFGGTAATGTAAFGWIGIVVTAITTLIGLYNYLDDKWEKAQQAAVEEAVALRDNAKAADETYENHKKLVDQLGDFEKLTEEQQIAVQESAKDVAEAYGVTDEELKELVKEYGDYNKALEAAIDAHTRLNAAQNQETYAKGKSGALNLVKRADLTFFGSNTGTPIYATNGSVASYTAAETEEQAISGVLAGYDELRQRQAVLIRNGQYLTEEYEENRKTLERVKESAENLRAVVLQESLAMYELANGPVKEFHNQAELSQFAMELADLSGLTEEGKTALYKYALSMWSVSDSAEDAKNKIKEAADAVEEADDGIAAASEVMAKFANDFASLESGYTTLESAVKEFNESGAFSASTFKSLVDSGLLQYLHEVDGSLAINEEAFYADAEAAKLKALADIQAAWASDALALAEGRVEEMSAGAQSAIATMGSNISTAGNDAQTAANKMLNFATATLAVRKAAGDNAPSKWDLKAGAAVDNYYRNLVNQINSVTISTNPSGRGGGGGSSRSSAANERANTYIEVLKAMLDDADFQVEQWTRDGGKEDAIIAMYERVMREIESVREKYLAEGYDETSDEVQELTKLWWKYADAIEDIHDDIAKQVQNTWDELDNAIDAEIDALKEARDLEEDQLDLEEKRLAVLEAEQALLDARNDRSVRKYNADGSWEWVADERNIQSAQEAYDKARETHDKALQDKEYADLEAEWEAIKKAIEDPGRDISEILNDVKNIGTPAMKKQVDNITSLLGKMGYNIAVVGAAKSGGVTSSDSAQINKLLTGDYSGATFDNGGVAGIKGIMLKNTQEAETVLPPSLTKAIISPQRNAQFSTFTDALTKMFGMAEYRASGAGTITRNYGNTDSHDTTYTVNGVQIGWAQAQRPFYEVMRDIVVYTNPN